MHDEGPSGGQEADFTHIQDEDTDLGSQSSKLKEIIQEQQNDIQYLSLNLERAKWIINYLYQRNKQLDDQQTIMDLQKIRANRQAAKRRKMKLTTLEQEIQDDHEYWLERIQLHLERMLEKGNNEKKHVEEHGIPLLVKKYGVQSKNQEFESQIEESHEEEKREK